MRTAMKRAQSGALLTLATSATLASATPNIPPPPQREPIMITNAVLHTVSGPVINNGRMLIENGRIVAIGEAAAVPDRTGAKVISLGGKRAYPGLIVANSSLGLAEIQAVKSTLDTTEVGALNPNVRALVAVNPDSELLPVARANGVLAALTVPRASPTGLIAGTSALIQLDGWTWEDMGLIPEVGLHVTLPTMRFNPALFPTLMQSRLDEMQRLTTQRLKSLDDALEAAAAYVKAKAADANAPVDTRWEAMRSVLAGQRPMFVRADELPQIRYALALAERYSLKLVIIGGMDAWRITDLLRERNVPVIIAGIQRLPMRRGDDVDSVYRLAGQLAKAGVKFAIARSGSEFDAATDRTLPYEAAAAAAHGLSRDEALKAITLYPAQILGAADKLGSLETGKLATFFVADGDPLDIRTNIERIFIQGREIELSDRQTKLNDKYQQKYLQLKK